MAEGLEDKAPTAAPNARSHLDELSTYRAICAGACETSMSPDSARFGGFMRAYWTHSRFLRSAPESKKHAARAVVAAEARLAYLNRLRQKEAAETDPQIAIRIRLSRIMNMQLLIGFQSVFDVAQAQRSFLELEALQEAVTGSAVSEDVRGYLADQSATVEEIRADTASLRRALADLE